MDIKSQRSKPAAPKETELGWRPDRCHRVALVLQGGGALGAYQAGVYQALHEANIRPDWISGVSIGAINAAIISGNKPEDRIERLHEFWDRITARKIWHYTPDGDMFRKMRNSVSSFTTTALGQPGFFKPRFPGPLMSAAGAVNATSYYDTSPLRETLLELVDFDLLNQSHIQMSVGAVNVATGNFVYFDNKKEAIAPEHVMASGALPPAFPMTRIGTDYFWDGGIVSNTPLQYLLDSDDTENALVFQVDLFNARGPLPRDMADVMARHKDIMYSSRTRYNTDVFRRVHRWKGRVRALLNKVPEELLTDEERALKIELEHQPEMTILQLINQTQVYEGEARDYEFSGTSMREHWAHGYEDTTRTLKRTEWLNIPPSGGGIVSHDIHSDSDR